MKLSIVRAMAVMPLLTGSLAVSAATTDITEGQSLIEALRATDEPTGIASLTREGGACLAERDSGHAPMPSARLAIAHQKWLRPPAGSPDYIGDLAHIPAGEGRALEIDRRQFGLPPVGDGCRLTRYISTPVQLGERAYVEIGYDDCGPLCGGGSLFALRKDGDRWVSEGVFFHWVS